MAKITTLQSNVRSGGALNSLALDALVSGADKPIFQGDSIQYYIFNDSMSPDQVEFILSVPGTVVDDYRVTRWYKVVDLSEEIPTQFPASSITEEDVTRQLTFAEVDARSSRSISQYSDGFYYTKASIAYDCDGLTLDEYKACGVAGIELLEVESLPSQTLE